MITITEADVEAAAPDCLRGLGWQMAYGADKSTDTPNAERDDYGQVVPERRLRGALLPQLVSEDVRVVPWP